MSIQKQYRVTVDIPQVVWDKFHETAEWNHRSCTATEGHIEAGSIFYGDPFEYAVFESYEAGQLCEKKLMNMVYFFAAKLTP